MQAIIKNFAFGCCVLSALNGFSQKDSEFNAYQQPVPGSDLKIQMQPIKAGTILIDQKKISVSPFWMAAFETTYDIFDVFYKDENTSQNMETDAVTRPSPQYIDFSDGMGKQGGFPVNSLSHTSALMFCRWLYEKTGVFYRLPTEAEWEYACRAGAETKYPFGDDASQLNEYAWFSGNSDHVYHKTGLKKPNAWGLYDMLGNVGEWTLDQYEKDYGAAIASLKDPVVPHRSRYPKTLRGGHYKTEAAETAPGARMPSEPSWNRRDPQIPKSAWWMTDAPFAGFRLVRPEKQPSREDVLAFFDEYLAR